MDAAFRWAYDNTMPFGNIICLFFGDFCQIAPDAGRSITTELQLLNGFEMVELTEGMRQKGDLKFLNALNNFSEG